MSKLAKAGEWMRSVPGRVRTRFRQVSPLLTFAYVGLVFAGLAAVVSLPNAVTSEANQVLGYIWAAFLIVGGLFSASDMFTGRRGGELFGNIPLFVAIFLYGATLLYRQWQIPGLASAGTVVAWIAIAFSMFIIARFLVILAEAVAGKKAMQVA